MRAGVPEALLSVDGIDLVAGPTAGWTRRAAHRGRRGDD